MLTQFLQNLQGISSSAETSAVLSSYLRNYEDPGEKVDYTDFSKHCWFNSAKNKVDVFLWRLFNEYDRTSTWDEYYSWRDKLSGYEKYNLDKEYPSYKGFFDASGSMCYISGIDYNNKMALTASSNDLSIEFCFNLTSSFNKQCIIKRGFYDKYYEVYLSSSSGSVPATMVFEVCSGTTIFSASYWLTGTYDLYHGNHIAFCYNSASISTSIYFNYNLITTTGSAQFGPLIPMTGSVFVGCSSSDGIATQQCFLTGSIDELRVWNSYRTADQIREYGMRHVRQEPELIFYLKFNEPAYVTEDGSQYNVFYDYSKNPINCDVSNYMTTCKVYGTLTDATGSAILIDHCQDPIVLSDHPDVQTWVANNWNSGSEYDRSNRYLITNFVPENYFDEEADAGTSYMTSLLYLFGRQLDEMKLHIEHFGNFHKISMDSTDVIPYKMLKHAIELYGFGSFDNFPLADPNELFRNYYVREEEYLALQQVNEIFWRSLLSSLTYIYKAKGTKDSVKSFINCLGLNENVVSIKDYSSTYSYPVTNSFVNKTRYSQALDFGFTSGSTADGIWATCGASGANIYITSSQFPGAVIEGPSVMSGNMSIETLVAFKPYSYWESGTFYDQIVTSQPFEKTGSIWWINNIEWLNSFLVTYDDSQYGLFYTRELTSSYGKVLVAASSTNSGTNVILTSPEIPIFDGKYYNIAYRKSGSNTNTYVFLDVRQLENDSIKYHYTGSIQTVCEALTGTNTLSQEFNIGAGSPGPNITVPVTPMCWIFQDGMNYTTFPNTMHGETKQAEVRLWKEFLSGSELDAHCQNYTSIGTRNPDLQYQQTLIGHWILDDNITTASFDVGSGWWYLYPITNYSAYGTILDATGYQFLTASNNFTYDLFDYNYLCPDISLKWNQNKVQYGTHDDIIEEVENLNLFTVEFNLADALNEDIIRLFSDLAKFSMLVGNPTLAYRNSYDLQSCSFYFNRLDKNISFTNYFNNLKWIDKFYFNIIEKLIPARCNFYGDEKVIESHMLERSKLTMQKQKNETVYTTMNAGIGRTK